MKIPNDDFNAITKFRYLTEIVNHFNEEKVNWKEEIFLNTVLSKIRNEDTYFKSLYKYSSFELMNLLELYEEEFRLG